MKYNTDEILKILNERLSEKRLKHTINCAECAKSLAKRFGVSSDDAYIAGLLHDITREISYENQLKLCEKHGIILNSALKEVPELLHAVTGAFVAKEEFGANPDVCSAILHHTTGDENMTELDKCLWLADLIEPGRNFPGVSEIREIAQRNLDAAVIAGFEHTIIYLIQKKKPIHPTMLLARNAILHNQKGI